MRWWVASVDTEAAAGGFSSESVVRRHKVKSVVGKYKSSRRLSDMKLKFQIISVGGKLKRIQSCADERPRI